MRDYALRFDTSKFKDLDSYALLACQDYNLTNHSNWFGEFRSGMAGFWGRLHGVASNFADVHSWGRIHINRAESLIASTFFNMDSAIECLAYSLNALGYAALPHSFWNINDPQVLKNISPLAFFGDNQIKPKIVAEGVETIFPTIVETWSRHRESLFDVIVAHHDASKHRKSVFVGGQVRTDPPQDLLDQLGIKRGSSEQFVVAPMAEILLKQDPKDTGTIAIPQQPRTLELLASEFVDFISESGAAALTDAKANIFLNESELRE